MPLSPELRTAIIDLDGTLVDTLGDFHAALNAMLRGLALPEVTPEVVSHFIGKGSEHLIRQTLAHVGAPADLYDGGWDAYQEAYRGLNGRHSALYPGAAEGIQALRAAGWRLACLTNKPGEFARELLAAKGIAQHFEIVFGGDAFERKKPDPLPVLKTCEALGTASAMTLVVGDSRNDAAAGHAAGCPVVLVTYGYNHGEPVREVPAEAYVDSLLALAALPWIRQGGRAMQS
ncbi:MAG TPA: phosphoglycolate phosphatase [Ramlibacter sp.]|jgi:phosphoglycolate phosphatase|nr:phosphoglycolate phosphatase [Ramlibacter sp.]